ncbi:hypothetical protein R6Q59_030628 [Mikania micrantha]|uniref:PRLI-interacting factor A n=1 Tax=Mikania micrantha TaxID=192012 RepID=A0A5N6NYD6_9ASTR|nr:hypothetical protein E3N88_16460 [Mikania micrantha]
MLDQSSMMNHSMWMSMVSQSQKQAMNNQNSRITMNQFTNPSHMMMNQSQLQRKMNSRRGVHRMWPPAQADQVMIKSGYISSSMPRNYRNRKGNNNNRKKLSISINKGSNLTDGVAGGYCPSTLNKLQQQNRLKPRRNISKKKFKHRGKSAPFAPRNTTSFLIRAKKAGGITSLVSPCPVTPAVLPTPVFSPSREVLVDMAKEEWGVDGYGSMKGLIRLRSPGNDEDGGSSESSENDVEEQIEVERRLNHDLSRFEMICPNNGGSYVLENRLDDQETHVAQLEEENLMLKDRFFLMERKFNNLRTRLQCLEMQAEGLSKKLSN